MYYTSCSIMHICAPCSRMCIFVKSAGTGVLFKCASHSVFCFRYDRDNLLEISQVLAEAMMQPCTPQSYFLDLWHQGLSFFRKDPIQRLLLFSHGLASFAAGLSSETVLAVLEVLDSPDPVRFLVLAFLPGNSAIMDLRIAGGLLLSSFFTLNLLCMFPSPGYLCEKAKAADIAGQRSRCSPRVRAGRRALQGPDKHTPASAHSLRSRQPSYRLCVPLGNLKR